MRSRMLSRRELIKAGSATGAAGIAPALLPEGLRRLLAAPASCGKLTDIEHVVIFIQENRSFDHYFGSYRGVRGFADQSPAFRQLATEAR
jgi:phospholipase C